MRQPRITTRIVKGLRHLIPVVQVNIENGTGDLEHHTDSEFAEMDAALQYIRALCEWFENR